MMKNLLALTFLLAASSDAFVPAAPRNAAIVQSAEQSTTSLGPGFLKDLGFEKPSWLPDFGGGDKKETEPAAAAEASAETGDEAEDGAESEEVAAE